MTWHQTRLTKLLQISYPIIQAGMAGGITSPRLVAAVSNAGGLGTLGAGYMTPEAIRQTIREIRKRTDRFAVNLMVPVPYERDRENERRMKNHLKRFEQAVGAPHEEEMEETFPSFEEQVHVLLEEKVPVFSFTFGIPDPAVIQTFKSNQTVVIGTATTVKEAVELEKSGVDAVVAQGSEAGGHRGTFLASSEFPYIGTMALVPQVADHVNIPVIAAGGIMDGRGVLASLALGADGVQMGSAFLTTLESEAHQKHKEALVQSTDESTVITTAFSGRPARGIKNTFTEEMKDYPYEIPPYPVQNALTRNLRKYAAKQGNVEYMSMWAGQAASLSRLESVEELMNRIIQEVDACLERFS